MSDFSLPILITASEHYEAPYDHVHHAKIIRLLELGRDAFLESRGHSFKSYFDAGQAMVVAALNIQYLREVREGGVRVTCAIEKIDGKKIAVKQTILNSKGKPAVVAAMDLIFMSLEKRRSMYPPERFVEAMKPQG